MTPITELSCPKCLASNAFDIPGSQAFRAPRRQCLVCGYTEERDAWRQRIAHIQAKYSALYGGYDARASYEATQSAIKAREAHWIRDAQSLADRTIAGINTLMPQRRRKGIYHAAYQIDAPSDTHPTILKRAALSVCWHYAQLGREYATRMTGGRQWVVRVSWETPSEFHTITYPRPGKAPLTMSTEGLSSSPTPPAKVLAYFLKELNHVEDTGTT